MRPFRFLLAFTAAALLQAADKPTFTETIAPILYKNCVACHRPGEAAPFALISYEDVKKRGSLIATVTRSRYMPPWHAEHGYGEFAGERRLSDTEIAAIGEWVKQGMPEGNRAKMPKVPEFTDGWQLGKPDLILEMPEAFEVPASGPDIYRNFAIPTGLTQDKWVRAVEFRPTARKAVHHAIFAYVKAGAFKNRDGQDGKPGFGGLNGLGFGVGVQPGLAPAGGLGGWAVGTMPVFVADDQAVPLSKGTDFILQMHFHPTGKPETERAVVGLYFGDRAPEKKVLQIAVPALFGLESSVDIAPGVKNYSIHDSVTLPADVRVLSAFAHAHYIGKDLKAMATLPDGGTQPLLWIKDWDFNWQEQYNYKQPVFLPKGTRIDVTIGWDNSGDNPRNPSNPPKRVLWGEQSFDEMGGIMFALNAVRKEDEAAIEQSAGERVKASIGTGLQNGSVARFVAEERRAAEKPQQIALFDRQGKTVSRLGEPGLYSQAALSPDGKRVAVIKTDRDSGDSDVWVIDIASGKSTRITADPEQNASPVWSPDGKQIAYVSVSISGNANSIYRKSSDGSGNPALIYAHKPGEAVVVTDWSVDGRLCFWAGDVTYELPLNGERKPNPLFGGKYSVRAGRFSPDGRYLAFSSNESGRWDTYVADLKPASPDAKPVRVSTDGALGAIAWRQDGKELYYMTLPGFAIMGVDVTTATDLRVGTPKMLFRQPVAGPGQLSSIAGPDGQTFVFVPAAR
ncbi:MAG: PD40 domain-containing protein [Bryobacterales bacterium]|nr:PD40 domain-containing protein [Bryobacterales bacterium]